MYDQLCEAFEHQEHIEKTARPDNAILKFEFTQLIKLGDIKDLKENCKKFDYKPEFPNGAVQKGVLSLLKCKGYKQAIELSDFCGVEIENSTLYNYMNSLK